MSTDEQHEIADLFDTSTDTTDSSTDEQSTEETSTENAHETEGLDLKPTADKKSEMVNSWAKKIAAGEATLEDLASKQKWILGDVKAKLEAIKKPDEDQIAKAVEKALAAKQAEQENQQNSQKFKELEATIKSLNLPVTTLQRINENFRKFNGKLNDYDNLQNAAEIAGVDFEGTNEARRSVSTPKIGYGSNVSKNFDIEQVDDVNTMTQADRLKYIQSLGLKT